MLAINCDERDFARNRKARRNFAILLYYIIRKFGILLLYIFKGNCVSKMCICLNLLPENVT